VNRDLRAYLPVLIALGALVLVIAQTLNAFERADRLGARPGGKLAPDPYARLEALLAASAPQPAPERLRDPFVDVRTAPPPTTPDVKPPAPAAPRPVVTAIISDGNAHSAIVRVENRSYTVKAGELFAGFQVVSVSASEVVLDNRGERMTLRVSTKGR
jgi:hypothetical protein